MLENQDVVQCVYFMSASRARALSMRTTCCLQCPGRSFWRIRGTQPWPGRGGGEGSERERGDMKSEQSRLLTPTPQNRQQDKRIEKRKDHKNVRRQHLINGHLAATLAPVDFVEHSLKLRSALVRCGLQARVRKRLGARTETVEARKWREPFARLRRRRSSSGFASAPATTCSRSCAA